MCKEATNNAAPTRQQKIDLLNARVQKITKKAIHEAKESGDPLALEFVHAQKKMTPVTAGFPVVDVVFKGPDGLGEQTGAYQVQETGGDDQENLQRRRGAGVVHGYTNQNSNC